VFFEKAWSKEFGKFEKYVEPVPVDWRTEAKKLDKTTEYETSKDTALFEIDTGKIVKEFKKGERLNIDYEYKGYFLTAWSFDRSIKNGFKVSDMKLYVEPIPEPIPDPDPIPEPPQPPSEIDTLKAHILDLEEEIKGLRESLVASSGLKEELKASYDRNEELERDNIRIEEEKKDFQIKYDELKREVEEGRWVFIKKITGWISGKVEEILAKITSSDE
jgi:hypothetical protein